MSGFYDQFADWRRKTATLKRNVLTRDAAGRPVETEETVAGPVEINYWTDTSRETNQNDRFVDSALGTAILPASLTVDTTMWMDIGGVKHYVVGVDNVAAFDEILIVSWRREHGE